MMTNKHYTIQIRAVSPTTLKIADRERLYDAMKGALLAHGLDTEYVMVATDCQCCGQSITLRPLEELES